MRKSVQLRQQAGTDRASLYLDQPNLDEKEEMYVRIKRQVDSISFETDSGGLILVEPAVLGNVTLR
jgi:hypothetical protein